MYYITGDWHTHTRYSDGKGTVEDNVRAAVEKGLKEIAITDHGPRGIYIGVKCAETYLKIKEEIQKLQGRYPVNILLGAEANVIDPDGTIDVPPEIIAELDILLAGLHPQAMAGTVGKTVSWMLPNLASRYYHPLKDRVRAVNTMALVNAIYRNPINVVTHPDLMMPVDVYEVAAAAAEADCAVEINAGHYYYRDDVLKAALQAGASLAVNSDAHSPRSVGVFDSGTALLKKYKVPASRVINAVEMPETSTEFVFKRGNACSGGEEISKGARHLYLFRKGG